MLNEKKEWKNDGKKRNHGQVDEDEAAAIES
jgi:hypothetical protein